MLRTVVAAGHTHLYWYWQCTAQPWHHVVVVRGAATRTCLGDQCSSSIWTAAALGGRRAAAW